MDGNQDGLKKMVDTGKKEMHRIGKIARIYLVNFGKSLLITPQSEPEFFKVSILNKKKYDYFL
ncbi:hypothetical protein M8C21_018865 [Ambrosia artemisiifolia]|uniref:Uncharacterized protein n=1 Tax=Ambrosia artemisiifolia TaxID=4212 RepID=A0AAD5BZB1_AMBAR|nr:hypothetical protein M8C21_018865 [Ambrosia artemisiifolia]